MKQSHMVEVEILSLTLAEESTENCILTLGTKNDNDITLKMSVGLYEAQALTVTIEKMKPAAPLPLDLLKDMIIQTNFTVQKVEIYKVVKGAYKARIICISKKNELQLRARPVDAVNIATKFNSPIYANKALLG